MAAKQQVAPKIYRTVRRRFTHFDAVMSPGDTVEVSEWPNAKQMVESGYLSRDYTEQL